MDAGPSSTNMADVEMDDQTIVDEVVEMTEEPGSVSVTNVPDAVFEDQDTKVNWFVFCCWFA